MGSTIMLALAMLRDLLRVVAPRADPVAENLFLRWQLALYQSAKPAGRPQLPRSLRDLILPWPSRTPLGGAR